MTEYPFDIWGFELFDKIWSSHSFGTEQARLILEALNNQENILDVGTGVGSVAKCLVDQNKVVYGVDIRQESLDYVVQKISSQRFHPIHQNFLFLDFEDAVDGVSCASNLGYFDDIDAAVSVAYRALKGGGVFAATGYEAERMKKWLAYTEAETRKAIQDGKLILTKEEVDMLCHTNQKVELDSSKVNDFSERTREALKRAGFALLRDEKFYSETSYFIVAQKR